MEEKKIQSAVKAPARKPAVGKKRPGRRRKKKPDALKIALWAADAVIAVVLLVMLVNRISLNMGGELKISCLRTALEAAGQEEEISEVEDLVLTQKAPMIWKTAFPADVADLRLVTLTFQLENHGRRDAEMLGITVEPLSGDIAVYSLTGTQTDIPSGSSGQIEMKLLTTESVDATREVTVEYYVYGVKHDVTVEA